MKEKRYVRAIDALTRIKTDHPFSPQVTDAELKIADAYYLNKQYPEAISAFKEFQALHPTHESIPFVLYRLGQAHLDQFTATDREQKNTLIAKSYFEAVINTYPKSPYAAEARQRLAQALDYLADHEYNIASFYFREEKYAAARDRFEEIVRKYRGTPVAAKGLFFLGECYRKEKNNVRASLAYEALLEHYPKSPFVGEAKTQLAQLEKDKQDPLAMLLMRDRRPLLTPGAETAPETTTVAKLKDIDNLVAKKEVVQEEPGDGKSLFRRVVDTLNPFSSSNDEKKEEKKPESAMELLAKRKADGKGQSGGFFAWLNPFRSSDGKETQASAGVDNGQLVNQIDDSLKEKGIDPRAQTVAFKPPPAALPKVEEPAATSLTDTSQLLGKIDNKLNKAGRSVDQLPASPEVAEVFKEGSAAQANAIKATAPRAATASHSVATSGLLSGIDEKLKSKGVEPAKFEAPAAPQPGKEGAPRKDPVKNVELQPKLPVEKGPLFLWSNLLQPQQKPASDEAPAAQEKKADTASPAQPETPRNLPAALVKGPAPAQVPPPTPKPAESKSSNPLLQEEEPKGVVEQLKEDVNSIGRLLNPFRW
jgi:outer membrane assembly lipoprotein YfiO